MHVIYENIRQYTSKGFLVLAAGSPATRTTRSERQPQAGSAEALTEAGSPSTAGEVFAHPHHPCTTVPYYWTATQGLRRDASKQHKVSKCQNIDKEILFKIAYCTPNKMARVVDGGFAYGKIRKD